MVGRLTADPELRKTDSGLEVTRFSIAVSMGANKTSFFNVVAWRQTATFITRYFKKGDGICIDGHLEYRKYEKDGAIITVYEIICANAGFAEGRASTEGGQAPSRAENAPQNEFSQATASFEEMPVDDTLPF
jgi:single-strand DNA-binding protein